MSLLCVCVCVCVCVSECVCVCVYVCYCTFTSMTESTEAHGTEFVAAVCMSTQEHFDRSVQPVRDRRHTRD